MNNQPSIEQWESDFDSLLAVDEDGNHTRPFMNFNDECEYHSREVPMEMITAEFGCTHDSSYMCEHRAKVIKDFIQKVREEAKQQGREEAKKNLKIMSGCSQCLKPFPYIREDGVDAYKCPNCPFFTIVTPQKEEA